jgi:hypothetical protein
MKLGSLQLRVMLYIAQHTDKQLTAPQIADLFEFECRENVTTALRRAVESGWLTRDSGKPCAYGAGPQLLKIVGMQMP